MVSVIIPAYNAASRLKFSLESVLSQDYKNIEIIFVDDASNDDTLEIASGILEKNKLPFKILSHEKNSGVSAARNTGLKNAQGKYICFLDADDVIRENFISSLHDAITRENSDIAFCGLTEKFSDVEKNIYPEKNFSSGEDLIIKNSLPSFFCCMYDKNFLDANNLNFFEGCTAGEDTEFTAKAFCCAKKISRVNQCLYIYIHHEKMGSVRDNNTREKKILRYEHNTGAQIRTALFLEEHAKSQKLKNFIEKILLPQNIIRQCNLFAMKKDMDSYNNLIANKNARKILKRCALSRKTEIFFKAFMILHFPNFYYRLREK